MRVVGIDPGVTGAIALVQYSKTPEIWDLPVISIGTTKQIDPRGLADILSGWGQVDYVLIEDNRSNGANGALANFSMGLSMGICHGVAATLMRPVVRVKPREWQDTLGLSSVKRADRKEAHRGRARELWPSIDESLKRVKDHNRADALLIAEHGRRTL